jgi:hypothetical protein
MTTMTRTVTEQKIEPQEQVKLLRQNMLLCRSLGHAWHGAGDSGKFHVHEKRKSKIVAVSRTLSCTRCKCSRTDVYDYPSFDLVKHLRVYPDGYLLTNGASRIWRHHANAELFMRQAEPS